VSTVSRPSAKHVEVSSSHFGLLVDPDVWLAVAVALASNLGDMRGTRTSRACVEWLAQRRRPPKLAGAKIRDDRRGRVTLTKRDAPQRGRCERRFGRVGRASRDGVRRTADDWTAEEDDAVHMMGQFASDLANDHPAQAPADKAHRTVLRGNVLNDCGEPVSVALRMAMVDPEAPASRVVSEPAQVRAAP
jgi:hypothetical protein